MLEKTQSFLQPRNQYSHLYSRFFAALACNDCAFGDRWLQIPDH